MTATLHPSRKNPTPQRQRHLSPLRAAVLDIIIRRKRPIGAYEVLDALSAKMERTFFPASIYRILDHLVQANAIMRVECLNAYVALTPRPSEIPFCSSANPAELQRESLTGK